MSADKPVSKRKGKTQEREPISLRPLDFEGALSDLLKAGPHPKEGKERPSPKKERRPKDADAKNG